MPIVLGHEGAGPGATAVVAGVGAVGLNAIQGARLSNADVIIAVDVDDRKLGLARAFGVTHTVSAARDDAVARVRELTAGRGADYVFEAAGKVEGFRLAVEAARPRRDFPWLARAYLDGRVKLVVLFILRLALAGIIDGFTQLANGVGVLPVI